MNKEFIPYEQALELKELGFDEECLGNYVPYFSKEGWILSLDVERMNVTNSLLQQGFSAPLYQQAFRWFREKKLSDSYVYRYQDRTDGSINYGYSIINDYGIEETRFIKENYKTYKEAELACLRRLIEIVKNK